MSLKSTNAARQRLAELAIALLSFDSYDEKDDLVSLWGFALRRLGYTLTREASHGLIIQLAAKEYQLPFELCVRIYWGHWSEVTGGEIKDVYTRENAATLVEYLHDTMK